MAHRTKPILGTKLWFGPKRNYGWGWTPVSWEGWATTSAFVAVLLIELALRVPEPGRAMWWLVNAVEVAVLMLLCWLKGTSPGGSVRPFRRGVRSEAFRRPPDDPTFSGTLHNWRIDDE